MAGRGSSAAAPPGFFVLWNPPANSDINTTATFSGPVQLCIDYSGIRFSKASTLKLMHYTNGAWVDVTTSNDTVRQVICGSTTSFSPFAVVESRYAAAVQSPISAAGTSVFTSNRGSIPVKFTLKRDAAATCALPAATITLAQITAGVSSSIPEADFTQPSDSGSNFRVSGCQYMYNLSSGSLGRGTYLIQIWIDGATVGSATIGMQ